MEYKSIEFTAKISRNDSSLTVAKQLQGIIEKQAEEGWEYVRIETIETSISPESGCFGFSAKPGFSTYFPVIIFQRPSQKSFVRQPDITTTYISEFSTENITEAIPFVSATLEVPENVIDKKPALISSPPAAFEVAKWFAQNKKVAIGVGISLVSLFGIYKIVDLVRDMSFDRAENVIIDSPLTSNENTEIQVSPPQEEITNQPQSRNLVAIKTKQGSNLLLRAGPSQQSDIISKIPDGTNVELVKFSDFFDEVDGEKGKWCQINFNGIIGWVWGGYITKSNPVTPTLVGRFPQASQKLLSKEEISVYSSAELKIMRNEILARHGFIFQTPDMKLYYQAQAWYKARFTDVNEMLTELEKQNIELIKESE